MGFHLPQLIPLINNEFLISQTIYAVLCELCNWEKFDGNKLPGLKALQLVKTAESLRMKFSPLNLGGIKLVPLDNKKGQLWLTNSLVSVH